MKSPKVRLYIRVRYSDGRKPYLDPFWNRNRTLRQGYALVDGQPVAHPTGCYYLRYLRNGKRVWESVGRDADAAVAALRNKEHDLRSLALGRAPMSLATPEVPRVTNVSILQPVSLDVAVAEYLDEIRRFRSYKTILASEQMLKIFLDRLPDKYVSDITRKDLLDHMSALKDSGKGDRTVYNHIMRVSFLKANGIVGLLRAADKPTYDEIFWRSRDD